MKATTIPIQCALAVLAAVATSAFVPSGPYPSLTTRTCSDRSFGGVCKSTWG